MPTNHERITRALDLLTAGLYPYVEEQMKRVYQDRWIDAARESFRRGRDSALKEDDALKWDAHALLTVMWDQWNSVFRTKLGFLERSLVSELRESRNQWAHQRPFDLDDTYRLLDSVQRLLVVADDAERAIEVADDKRALLRELFVVQEDIATRTRKHRREIRFRLAVYVVCCLIIVTVTFRSFGFDAWYVIAFVLVTFAYFTYNLLTHEPNLLKQGDPGFHDELVEETATPH